jgi:hypothetical protein
LIVNPALLTNLPAAQPVADTEARQSDDSNTPKLDMRKRENRVMQQRT